MRRLCACLAIFVATLTIYMANGETISSYDTAPSTLFAYNLLAYHTLDFDRFRHSYFDALGGGYAFVEAPDGHLSPVFPIGTALLTYPLYAAMYALDPPGDITSPRFELRRARDEKRVAATIAALSAVLLYLCARLLGTPLQAGVVTALFAFGTDTWMTSSQALWQHGPVSLVTLGLIYALLRAARAAPGRGRAGWLVLAGACAGFLPVIRPTALLFSLAGGAYALATFRRASVPFWIAAAGAVAPGIGWNLAVFHVLSGGYAVNLPAYDFAPADVAVAFAGLLVSPSRGLLVFTPLVVFAVVGAVRAARAGGAEARLLLVMAGACVALTVNYACTLIWEGGACYGPRFLTDVMGPAALLWVYVVPRAPRAFAAGTAVFALVAAYSVAVQAAGAWGGAAGARWNGVPIDIARRPARVWQLRDSQIERNVRGTYYHIIPDYPTRGAAYAAGFAGDVLAVTAPGGAPIVAAPGSSVDLTALVRNTGTSPWYGYPTAVYNGEAQVRVRVVNARGALVRAGVLYVDGAPRAGETGTALGTIVMPAAAGTYRAALDVIAFGIPSTAQRRATHAFGITFTIR
jgi:hypothetical protein